MNSVQAEILDKKTERECNNGECIITFHTGDIFIEYNNILMYFNQFSELSENSTLDIKNTQLDGVEITYTPFVVYNGQEIDINNAIAPNLDYQFINSNERDFSKFTIEFNRLIGMSAFGFKVNSNRPITYKDFNHFSPGVYTNEEPEEVLITNLYTAGREISYIPEIDNGWNVTFDKKTDKIYFWIQPSFSQKVSIDPIISVNSTVEDGHTTWTTPGATCVNIFNTTTINDVFTLNIGGNTLWSQAYPLLDSNTSIVPDDATINAARVLTYAHLFTKRCRDCPGDLWSVGYNSIGTTQTNADCGTRGNFIIGGIFEGNLNWAETNGWKNKSIQTSSINKTGNTSIEIYPNWIMTGETDESYAKYRAFEYAGVTSDPYLQISYTEAAAEEEIIPSRQPKVVYPFILLISIMFIASRGKNEKK